MTALLAGGLSCGVLVETEGQRETKTTAAPQHSLEDLKPRYLGVPGGEFRPPRLRLLEEVTLEPDVPISRIEATAFSEASIFVADSAGSRVSEFDRRGKLVRHWGHPLPDGTRIKFPFDVLFSAARGRVLIPDIGAGIWVFDSSGGLQRLIKLEPRNYPHRLAELSNGDLVVAIDNVAGPYLALVSGSEVVRSFCGERMPPVAVAESFRPNLSRRYLQVDSEDHVYVAERVDYEIRKFDASGSYVGDFRVQADPFYRPPPERISAEQKASMWPNAALREKWKQTWTQVEGLALVDDSWLVACLAVHGPERFRLHFYTRDGGVAFSPVSWPHPLVGADGKSLYFKSESDGSKRLLRYALGGES